MMNQYTTVANDILWDMLNAKSKLTDIEVFVDTHQAQLAKAKLLGPLRAILDSKVYGDGDDTFGGP